MFGSCVFLEKYGTKHFGAGISVYFHLSVGATIVYLKHGHRHNAMFKFFKHCLALVLSMQMTHLCVSAYAMVLQ